MGVSRSNIQGISLENLEQWGEEAGEGFPDFVSLWAEFPPVEGDFGAFFEVVQEVFSQFAADVAIIKDEVNFEILLEAADVHVGGSHGGYQTIHDDHFAVIESFAILEYPNTCF